MFLQAIYGLPMLEQVFFFFSREEITSNNLICLRMLHFLLECIHPPAQESIFHTSNTKHELIFPDLISGSFKLVCVSFWHGSIVVGTFPYFLVKQDVPDSFVSFLSQPRNQQFSKDPWFILVENDSDEAICEWKLCSLLLWYLCSQAFSGQS